MSKSHIAKQDALEMALSGKLPTSQQAAYNRLKKGKVPWSSTNPVETRAMNALIEKGLATKNLGNNMSFELATL